MGIRRGRLSNPDSEQFLASLNDLNVRLSEPASYDDVLSLAQEHGLTVYDAAYLNLAIQECLLAGQFGRSACSGSSKSCWRARRHPVKNRKTPLTDVRGSVHAALLLTREAVPHVCRKLAGDDEADALVEFDGFFVGCRDGETPRAAAVLAEGQ